MGESGPPCGVPSSTGLTKPSSITTALRKARMSLSTRLSDTRAATRAIKPSISKNFSTGSIKVSDVDSERMLLRIERGKGRKDRHAMLSPQLLELLRAWWREGRRLGALLPRGWLFPGSNPVEPLSTRQLNRAVHAAAEAAGIK